jgi:hypothetical protein
MLQRLLNLSDTMILMEEDFRMVDVLNADQLEINDLIGIGGEIVKVLSITPIHYGYSLMIENNFNEKDIIEISEDERFELFLENF